MTKWTSQPTFPTRPAAPPSSPAPTPGLGFETAAALAGRGAHVVLAVRNLEKGKQAAATHHRGHSRRRRRRFRSST